MNTNSFSLRRAAAVWRFYSPLMPVQACITLGAGVVAYVLALLSVFNGGMGLMTIGSFIGQVVIFCGPLLFARFRDKTFTTQLPATAAEQTLIAFAWCLLAVPLIYTAGYYASMGVAALFTDSYNVDIFTISYLEQAMNETHMTLPPMWMLRLQSLQNLVPITVALYIAVTARRNAVVFSLLGVFCTEVVLSILGGIAGAVAAFRAGFADGVAGRDPNLDGFMQNFSNELNWLIWAVVGFSIVVIIMGIFMVNHKYARRQL